MYFKHNSIILLIALINIQILPNTALSQSDIWQALGAVERKVPGSGDHPGNVFLAGETVILDFPRDIHESIKSWQLLNDAGTVIQSEHIGDEIPQKILFGKLGVGWYRLEFCNDNNEVLYWTTTAVLSKLKAPIPQDSPICVDGAHSWFAQNKPETQEQLARLAALCGVNWIRDRLRWRDIQPEPDQYAEYGNYDQCADLQNKLGLKILQVFHGTPQWAVQEGSSRSRFPYDLRHLYRFCRKMGTRFEHTVQAWEPWNEANAHNFGGHTVDEMCSMQKAAYLGFKAAYPNITVGWNAYAGVSTPLHTRGILANEAWSYFDTYNIHTYDWSHSYLKNRTPAIEAACGRPIWVTEADRGIKYETGEPWHDMSKTNEILKAQFIAQSYATSLYAGAQRHFHFILGHYTEDNNKVQFGLLRWDLTPRPAYVALAALGRMLAGAQCLGRYRIDDDPNIHMYAFAAEPDGEQKDVIVAWAERETGWNDRGNYSVPWQIPDDLNILEIHDYLGRKLSTQIPETHTSSPLFITMPSGEAQKLDLEIYPKYPFMEGESSPVVLQLCLPSSYTVPVKEIPWSVEQEHQVEAEKAMELPLYIYNFSDQTLHGTVEVEHQPEGWKLSNTSWKLTLQAMDRQVLSTTVFVPKREFSKTTDTWIRLRGEFEHDIESVLAFRLITQPGEGYER